MDKRRWNLKCSDANWWKSELLTVAATPICHRKTGKRESPHYALQEREQVLGSLLWNRQWEFHLLKDDLKLHHGWFQVYFRVDGTVRGTFTDSRGQRLVVVMGDGRDVRSIQSSWLVDAFVWNCVNQVRKNRPQSEKQRVAFAFCVKIIRQHLQKKYCYMQFFRTRNKKCIQCVKGL